MSFMPCTCDCCKKWKKSWDKKIKFKEARLQGQINVAHRQGLKEAAELVAIQAGKFGIISRDMRYTKAAQVLKELKLELTKLAEGEKS